MPLHPGRMVWGNHLFDGGIAAFEAYEHITSCTQSLPYVDLSAHLWTWEAPLKILCFSWLILHNLIITWDTLLKNGFVGPGRCSLCKSYWEDFLHLFILCPFTLDIWKKVPSLLVIQVDGDRSSIASWICSWERKSKAFQVVHIYVFFGAYGALGMSSSSKRFLRCQVVISSHCCTFSGNRPLVPKESSKIISLVDLSNTFPIFFFNGSSAGGHCGCGVSLHINSEMSYHFRRFGGGLVLGDNCRVEMLALWSASQVDQWLSVDNIMVVGIPSQR